MQDYIPNHRTLLFGVILASALFVGQCATLGHCYLTNGAIIKQNGNQCDICIGSDEGAREGQLYGVYTYKEDPELRDSADMLEKVYTGTIKITNVVHKHHSKAVLVWGKAGKGEMVELKS